MPNVLDFDEGYDAYELGEAYDENQSQDWKDGYSEAACNDTAD